MVENNNQGGWGRSKTAPLALKWEKEGCWWGLGTSVSHFDVRKSGGESQGWWGLWSTTLFVQP